MIEPLRDQVLVRPEEAEEVTTGGVILPEQAKKTPQRGVVVAVGPGRDSLELDNGALRHAQIPICVSEGDVVIYSKYGGVEVEECDGEKLLILRESDLLGVDR